MAARVGERDPGGAGRERPQPLGAALLKPLVPLQEVVEAKHEGVVGGALRLAGAEEPDHALAELLEPGRPGAAGQPGRLAVLLQQGGERRRRDPDARLGGIDVGEDAEDAAALRRPAGEGVHVQQVVAGEVAQAARRLFLRAVADAVELPAGGVARQGAAPAIPWWCARSRRTAGAGAPTPRRRGGRSRRRGRRPGRS